MNLTIIVAVSENNVIGAENKIPWYIKEDIKRFKQLTLNHPVIMGRRTYESIPLKFRPLPDRKNIVLSKNLKSSEGIYVAEDIEEALKLAEGKDTYIIGGRSVYESFLPISNRIELTRIHKNFEGDIFFPEVKWHDWKLVNEEKGVNKEEISYSFLTYLKNK